MKNIFIYTLLLWLLNFAIPLQARQLTSTTGSSITVDTDATFGLQAISVAKTPSGGFIVIGNKLTSASTGIVYAYIYDAEGSLVSGNINVGNIGANASPNCDVAVDNSGDFIVVWHETQLTLAGRRYNSNGTPKASRFIVTTVDNSTDDTLEGKFAKVDSDGDGNFVVVWGESSVSSNALYFQRYNSSEATQGGEVSVGNNFNSYNFGGISSVDVSMNKSDGTFVIAYNQATNGNLVFQRYTNTGSTTGSLTSTGISSAGNTDIVLNANTSGDFIIAYCNSVGAVGVMAYTSLGASIFGPVSVGNNNSQLQVGADIDEDRDVIVTWGVSSNATYREYSSSGTAKGSEATFGSQTNSIQQARVAVTSSGSFVAIHRDANTLKAQRFGTLNISCAPAIGTTDFNSEGFGTGINATVFANEGTGNSGGGLTATASNVACWSITTTSTSASTTLQIRGFGDGGLSNSARMQFNNSNPNYTSFSSSDGSEFDLKSFYYSGIAGLTTNDVYCTITGYRDGSMIAGATVNQVLGGNSLEQINIDGNSNFNNIDEFRIVAVDNSTKIIGAASFKVDEIVIGSAVSTPSDSDPPTITSISRSNPTAEITNADQLVFEIVFSEDVQNVGTADFAVTGDASAGAVSNVTQGSDASTYTVTVSGNGLDNGNGSTGLGFAGDQDIQDLAGNALSNTTPTGSNESYTVDNSAPIPTVSTTSGDPTSDNPIPITIAFGEVLSGASPFLASEIAVTNGTVGDFDTGDGATYTFNLTPDGNGTVSISIPAGVTADAAGNSNLVSNTLSFEYDGTSKQASINDPTISEGDVATTTLTFTISLNNPAPTGGATIDWATSNGTASAGSDYTADNGTVSFAAGEDSKTVDITVGGDEVVEADETITMTLSSPSGLGVSIGDATGTGTITNDDQATVTITDRSADENDGTVSITVGVDKAVDGGFSVRVSTADGTATTGDSDYTAVTNQQLTFAGTASDTETFTITLGGDTKVEADETIGITIGTLSPNTVNSDDITITDTGILTVTNDDQATVTIANESGNEDDGAVTFTATLDVDVDGGFDVDVSTSDGTATTADTDYTSVTNQTLSFSGSAGEAETFTVTPTSDTEVESDETVTISMSNVSAAKVDDGDIDTSDNATLTITNDDEITFSVNDPDVTEGDAGTATLTFTVSLSDPAPPGGATVDYATSDGTASNASDYTAIGTTTLSFSVGEETKTVDVAVNGDEMVEADETITLTLSNPTGTDVAIGDATGSGTITNDDQAKVTIADVAVDENDGTATVTLTLDNAVDGGFAVDVSTSDGTASTADSDYTAVTNATETFAGSASETETLTVTLGGDTKVEADETIGLAMSNLVPSTVDAADIDITDDAQITITNDDQATVTIANESGNEDDGAITVTVTLDVAVDGGFDVDVSTSDGTATIADTDYTSVINQTLSFSGNASETKTFTVTPTSDAVIESDETVTVSMSGLAPVIVAGTDIDIADNATVTITNDDVDNTSPTVSISSTAASPTNTAPIPVTVQFSESVTGFIEGDLTVSGGAVSGFTGSGDSYSFNLAPSGNGTLTVGVAANVAQDGAGNNNTAASQFSIVYDNIAPTVTLSSTSTDPTYTSPIPVTVTFSEEMAGFAEGDLSVSGGTVSGFSTSDNTVFTFDLTPTLEAGTLTVDIGGSVATDLAGNPNPAATQLSRLYDALGASTCEVQWHRGEGVAIAANAVTKNSGDNAWGTAGASSLQRLPANTDGGIRWTLSTTGVYALGLNTSDNGQSRSSGYLFRVTNGVLFSEQALSASPITGTTSLGAFTNGQVASIRREGTDINFYLDGSLVHTIAGASQAELVADLSIRTDGVPIGPVTANFCDLPPTATITSDAAGDPTDSPFTATFTFSQDVAGFEITDIVPSNAVLDNFAGSGDTYTVDVYPNQNGTVTLAIPQAAANAAAGGLPSAPASFSIEYGGSCDLEWGSIVGASNTAGTITKNTGDGDWGTSGATSLKVIPAGQDGYLSWPLSTQVTYTVGLSTDPAAQSNRTGYAIRVVNLTAFAEQAFPGQAITGTTGLGAFASGDVATIRRQGTDILFFIGGQLRHTIPNADQGELLANLSIRSDGASAGPFSGTLCLPAVPTVAIAADAKAPSREAFTATVTFSEAVTGFEQADIQATNATLSAFAGSGDTYTVTVTPAASGNLSLSIPQGAASDAQGTPTQASQAFTLSYDLPCSIAWENITGASESAGVLTKTAAGDSWNAAGASSQNVLPAGMDGYISWTLSSDTDVYSMGLATRDKDQSIRTGFALRVVQGSLFAEVDGPAGGSTSLGTFSPGQQAQIAREGNSIRFYLDGMPVHTMTAYQGNLVVDLSINTQNASVGAVGASFCNIGRDVAWGAPTGASVSNGTVTETAGTGQYGDSGAPAMNILSAGTDGWVSWELKRGLNHKYSIGIIPSSSLGGGAALPVQGYEFRQDNNGLYVYVDNTLAATVTTGGIAGFGPQVVIRRAGSDVLFFYDGQLVYTAPNAFQGEMGIGLALKQPGMSISGVRTSFDPAGPPPRLGAVRKSKELDEASSTEGLSLYPNPTQGVVNIMMSAQEGQTAHIAIYNALGQIVGQADLQAGGSEAIAFKADLADMPNGLYMVRVAIEGKLLQKSFVKR